MPLDDVTGYRRLTELLDMDRLPADMREWLGRKQREAAAQAWAADPRIVFIRLGPDEYEVGPYANPKRFESRSRGAAAIAMAVSRPGEWQTLPAGWNRIAWYATVARVLDEVAKHGCPATAGALAFSINRNEPGMHLRDHNLRQQIMWRPAPHSPVRSTLTRP